MNNARHPPPSQVIVGFMLKAVEVAAREAADAEVLLHVATEEKKVTCKIPKGKAGGGKGAKKAANQKYKEAQKDANEKSIRLENAKKDLENAERALKEIELLQVTTANKDDSLLRESSSDQPLKNAFDFDKNNGLESAKVDVETQNVSLESRSSGMISKDHMDRQHFSEELLGQTYVSRGSPCASEPSIGSKEQRNDPFDVENQGPQESVASESGMVSKDHTHRQHFSEESRGSPCASEPSIGSKEQRNDTFDVENQGPQESVASESGMVSKDHLTHRRRLSEELSHHQVSTGTPGEPNYASSDGKKRGTVTAGRVSRSTSKKLESAGMNTAQGTENVYPVTDEVENDGWVEFLSDPSSETDEEEEEDRVAEASKSKHPPLNAEEKRMYRFMKPDEKKKYDEKARTAINLYLQEGKEIDSGIRRMARLDPEFLPEAATTSRKLALHVLTSNQGNIMCGYHAFKNKASYLRDGWGKPGMKVRGIPGKRRVGTLKQRTKEHNVKDLGLGSCGCMIQDILLEFALSKRLSISGFVNGDQQSEMMSFHDYMEPRSRSFAFHAIRLMVPDLSLNDFYTHGEILNHEAGVAKKRALYWVQALNDKSHAAASLEGGEEYVLRKTVVRTRENELGE